MKLAIVASHPIQYQVPIFRTLDARSDVDLRVHFGHLPDPGQQGEDFGQRFAWDVPLLEGYRFDVFAQGLDSMRDVTGMLRAFRTLRETWIADCPDFVVHTGWHHPAMFPALAAARSLRLPCLLRCEANLFPARGLFQRLWHRLILRHYAAFLPIGIANAAYYDAFGPQTTPRARAPYGSGSQFPPGNDTDRRAEARKRFGIAEGEFCFLFVGKLVAKKRPADLLAAAERTRERPGMRVLMVGSGVEEDRLRDMAGNTLREQVVFAGFVNQSEMPLAYEAADCLVLPSDEGETWGLVVNEAMHFGLPAIVSDRVGCAPDLVSNGVTGWTFPCGNVERLADRMGWMLENPDKARRMGSAAAERVTKDYSVQDVVDGIVAACRKVRAPAVSIWAPSFDPGRGGIEAVSAEVLLACRSFAPTRGLPLLRPGSGPSLPGKIAFVACCAWDWLWRRPDAVWIMHLHFVPLAATLKRLRPLKVVAWIHGVEAWDEARRSVAGIEHVDQFVASSKVTRSRSTVWQSGEAGCRVIHPAVDFCRYSPGPARDDLRSRHGLPARCEAILTVGRLSASEGYKGHDAVIRSLPEVAAIRPEVRYLIVGEGDDRIRLERLARELDVGDRVIFAGYVSEEELPDHFRLASVFAMPSSGEGFGIVFLEALGCGCRVVAGLADGAADALDGGRFGALVDPADSSAVAAALLDALSSRETTASREELEAKFGRARFQRDVEDCVRKLVEPCAG